jgi:hypothetical protein
MLREEMKILLLAPQPFYQERGTPIAVALVLRGLSERTHNVEVITYHEGAEVKYEHVTVHRICKLPFVRHVRPGFSWKKIVCDFFMFLKAFRLIARQRYDLIHAVEESVFMALILKWLFKVPYIYDMDSSLPQQMLEKYPFLAPFKLLLRCFEGIAVRNAAAVMPVCDALARSIEVHGPRKVAILPDVSLLKDTQPHSYSHSDR